MSDEPPRQGPPPPPLPRPVQPLHYSPEPRPFLLPFGGRVALGFFGYLLLSALWIAAAWYGKVPVRLAFFGWLGLTAAALSSAIYVRVRYRYSGLGYGILFAMLSATILIVVGVLLLLLSICFGWMK